LALSKPGYYGPALYFSEVHTKADEFVFGAIGTGCILHKKVKCYACPRYVLLCSVNLGTPCYASKPNKKSKTSRLPSGFDR